MNVNGTKFSTQAFLDCGATDEFYDFDSAKRRNLSLDVLSQPCQLYLVDGRPAAKITHSTTINLNLQGHEESLTFYITKLDKYELILGQKWLRRHNPSIDWSSNLVIFSSNYCKKNYLPTSKK